MRSHDYAPLDVARWFAIIDALSQFFFVLLTPREMVKQRKKLSYTTDEHSRTRERGERTSCRRVVSTLLSDLPISYLNNDFFT